MCTLDIEQATIQEYPSFVEHLSAIMPQHNAQLNSRTALYGSYFAELMQMAYEVSRHSPFKRPYFAYLGYKGAGGTVNEVFTELGVGLELYDAALLLHDDIIDDDTMRNGWPNVYGVYADKLQGAHAKKTAASLALICGDTLYGLAFEKLLNLPVAETAQAVLSQTLFNAHLVLHAGQSTDIITETQKLSELTEEQIISGYKLKNQFNLEMPMQMGALAAGKTLDAVKAISTFAYPLGAAIQIANDIDVLFSERFDSKTTADLRGNKKTLILWYAWQKCTAKEKEFILSCMGNENITRAQVASLTQLLETTGARQAAYNKGRTYVRQAAQALDTIEWLEDSVKQRLHEFIQSVEDRLK